MRVAEAGSVRTGPPAASLPTNRLPSARAKAAGSLPLWPLAPVTGASVVCPNHPVRMVVPEAAGATDPGAAKTKRGSPMAEGIIVWLIIGAVAGWLAGKIVEGTGFGLIVDIIVGVVGALIGGWLAGVLGIDIGGGLIGSLIVAVVGAVILLLVLRLIKRVM